MVHRSEVDSTSTVPLPTNEESVDILSPAAAEEDAPVFNIGLSSVEDGPNDERGGGDHDPDDERGRGDYDPDDERGGGDDGLDERRGDNHLDDDERGGGSIVIINGSSSDRDDDQHNTSSTSNCVAVGLRGSSSDTSSAEEDDVLASTTRIETSLLSNTHMKTISGGKRRRKRKGVRTPLEEEPECRGMCGSGPKCLAKHPDDAGIENRQRDQQSLRRCANFGGVVQCPLWIGVACAEKFECNTCRICAVLKMPPSSSSEVEVGRYSIL